MATLARQSTPVGNRLDRTAAHAAVRNLAESYGVDLLPLDLSTDISFTPAPVLRRASEPGGTQDLSESNNIQLDLSSPAALSDPAEATISTGSKSQQGSPAVATSCEPDLCGAARVASSIATGTIDAADPPSVAIEQDSAAVDLAGQEAIAAADGCEQAWAEEPEDVEYLSEAEYLEYQIPLEHRIALLEEERDILVDKLLATTEALHASEARNRQSQASASQVGALLEQLQELLRRAEVERDRAKLQLKRQRGSMSQVAGGSSSSAAVARMVAAGPLPYTMSAPVTPAHKLAASSSDSVTSAEAARCSTTDAAYPADGIQPFLGDELQMRKKHKSSSEEAAQHTSGAEAAVSSATGGMISATPHQLISPSSLKSPVALTPSTDEARPPVKSVISGFEALARQRKRSAARKAAAARAAAAAQDAGLEYVPESSSGSDSGSPKSSRDAGAAGLPSEDGVDAVPSPVTADDGAFGPEAAAVDAQALQSGSRVPHIWVCKGISDDGSSHPQAVNDAAAEAAAAAASAELSSVSAGFSSSLGSPTPTAAALCNANPAGFCAEVLATDDVSSDAASDVITPSYAQVAARNSREWSVGGRSSKSSSPSPTRRPRVAALSVAGATQQQQQQQRHKSDASSSTGSTNAVSFNMGRSSSMSHSPAPGSSPKAAYSPKSAAAAAMHKTYSSSRLGVSPAESVIASAVAEAERLKQQQQQQQAQVYDPQKFKVGSSSSSSELGSSPDAAVLGAAPAASEPVVEFIAAKQQGQQQHGAAGSTKHRKQKQLQDKLQPKEAASKTPTAPEVDCSSAAAGGGGAVASAAAAAGCVAEVLTSGASVAAPPAVNATTAAGKGSDSNSSTPRSHKGKKAKGNIRQSENLAKAAAAVTEAAPAAASDTGAAAAAAKPAISVLLKVVVVLLLLCSGGLLYALYQTKSTYSHNTVAHQQMVMSYNWQLKALRDKVGKLERQLTEKDEQLGSCSSRSGSDGEL